MVLIHWNKCGYNVYSFYRNIFLVSVLYMSFYFLPFFFFPFFYISLSFSIHMHYIYKEFMCAAFYVFLNWGTIALQRCVRFCCTTKWISYVYTYMPSLLTLLLTTLSLPSIYITTGHQAVFPAWYRRFPLAICLTHGSQHVSIPIFQFILPSPPCPKYSFPTSEYLFPSCE